MIMRAYYDPYIVIHTFYPVGIAIIAVLILLLVFLFFRKPKLETKPKNIVILLIATVLTFGIGWFSREYLEMYRVNHQPATSDLLNDDCINC